MSSPDQNIPPQTSHKTMTEIKFADIPAKVREHLQMFLISSPDSRMEKAREKVKNEKRLYIVEISREPPRKRKWIVETDNESTSYRLESEYKEDMTVQDIVFVTYEYEKAFQAYNEIKLELPMYRKYIIAIEPTKQVIYEGIINLDDMIADDGVDSVNEYECPIRLRTIPEQIHLSDDPQGVYFIYTNRKGMESTWSAGFAPTLQEANDLFDEMITGKHHDFEDTENIYIFGLPLDTPLPYLFDLPILRHQKF